MFFRVDKADDFRTITLESFNWIKSCIYDWLVQDLTIEVVCDLQLITMLHSLNVQFAATSRTPVIRLCKLARHLSERARTRTFFYLLRACALSCDWCANQESKTFWPNVVGVVVRALDPRGHKKAKNARSVALLLLQLRKAVVCKA